MGLATSPQRRWAGSTSARIGAGKFRPLRPLKPAYRTLQSEFRDDPNKMFALLRTFLLLLAFVTTASAQTVTASYQPISQIRNTDLRQLQMDWRRGRLLESLAENLSQKFTLNQMLTIGLGECGQPNAFYQRDRKIIVVCLELIPNLVDRVRRERSQRASPEEVKNLVAGSLVFVVLHEMGHALIDLQGLPVLGREEDAADQISTFLILEEPALADRALAGGVWFFSSPKLVPNFFSQRHLSDEHGLDPQRVANIACWAYGRDPQRYVWAMHAARVTNQRAARCYNEYAQLDRSVRELLKDSMR